MRLTKKLMHSVKLCSWCGKRIITQGYHKKNYLARIMKNKGICYECAFWQCLIDYPDSNLEILGTKAYRIYPAADKRDKTLILGGKGKMRFFMQPRLRVFSSNDIWLVGEVPERFQSHLKPTIKEITRKAYERLTHNPQMCKSRGCFDRYNCIRYNISLESEYGPFNSVPANWKVGDEHCRFFINNINIIN